MNESGKDWILAASLTVANASGKVLDVALGFAVLLEEYGEEIFYISNPALGLWDRKGK
mgnify:CR=1 FL=1